MFAVKTAAVRCASRTVGSETREKGPVARPVSPLSSPCLPLRHRPPSAGKAGAAAAHLRRPQLHQQVTQMCFNEAKNKRQPGFSRCHRLRSLITCLLGFFFFFTFLLHQVHPRLFNMVLERRRHHASGPEAPPAHLDVVTLRLLIPLLVLATSTLALF